MPCNGQTTSWIVLRDKLINLTSTDRNLQGEKPEQPAPLLARLYTQYTNLIRALDTCWSLLCQPQRNIALKRLLDAAIVRLSELRDLLTELDISEFHYVDGALIEMKLIPTDLEVIPLESHPLKRSEQMQELAKRLYSGERIYVEPDPDAVEDEEHVPDDEEEQEAKRPRFKRPVVEVLIDPRYEAIKEAIRVLQKHERGRQARLEFFDEKTMFDIRKNYFEPKPIPQDISSSAALAIQKLWRGYCVRRDMKDRENKVRLMIKMYVPSYRPTGLMEQIKEHKLKMQQKRQQKLREYEEARVNEKTRVLKMVGPGLMEDIGDEIRWWFRNWYDVAKAFDKYPPPENGGTIIVIRGETLTPEEYRIEQERIRIEKEKLKKNPELAKKMAADAAKKKKEAQEKAKKEKEKLKREKKLAKKRKEPEEFQFKESPALKQAQEADKMFDEEWSMGDEEMAQDDKIIMEKITEEKCHEMQIEIRKLVDEMMRLELEMLEDALQRDRSGKKGGKKKDKKKKKKGKKKGGKKGKGKKDITANRAIEDLFQELYDNEIIHKYASATLDDFFGEYSYSNLEMREQVLDPLPALGDLRQVIMNTCVLPLGGEGIQKPKSVCIFGPKQSGKHLLINAICTATDAVLFDLSPATLAGKYPKKSGMKMLVHLINKMSRILQPSILYIDGAEKVFYKKVPKPEKKLEPKKLKGQLFKGIVKLIKPEDRVMLIGISGQPWAATPRPFIKAFDKFIMIPRTDYGTIYLLWMDILMKYHGIHRDIDVSALAKATVGYPVPYIEKIAAQVLCARRLVRFKFEPVRLHELLEGLIQGDMQEPVTPQEQDKFTTWYNKKTKLGKMKTKIVQDALQKRLEQQALEEKKKKK